MSNKMAYLSVACDTDPDINPSYRKFQSTENPEHIWQGITVGIDNLRLRLEKTSFLKKYKQLPVTWLLRADRQIYELYGNASFCFQRYENIWKNENKRSSEIGWHPHLYRWNEQTNQWMPYLNQDDDVGILEECLHSLRQCTDILSVRTGWIYHSNILMNFFNKQKLLVDASAIPGCTQSGIWFYDWRGTERNPYHPSKHDYRVKGKSPDQTLNILEMPVLVRRLSLPLHIIRHYIRKLMAIRSTQANLTDWESSRWQGALLTRGCRIFNDAVKQTISENSDDNPVFLTTYFHTDELLLPSFLERFVQNLESLSILAEKLGYTLVPITLSTAASLAKKTLID